MTPDIFKVFVICASLICPGNVQRDSWGIQLPPPGYDHYPSVGVMEMVMRLPEVDAVCTYGQIGIHQKACTRFSKIESDSAAYLSLNVRDLLQNPLLKESWKVKIRAQLKLNPRSCYIILPEVDGLFITKEAQESIRHHEWAHCNGVVHDGEGHGWYDMKTGNLIQSE